jgi:hypothetical protein
MEVTSKMIVKADGTTGQNARRGSGIKTPHIQDGAVTRVKIRDNSVGSAKIRKADGTTGQNLGIGAGIKTPHIQDGAVTESKLGDQSVTSSRIKDGSVGTAELANSAVTSEKLAASSVTYEKLDSNTTGKLVTNGNNHDHSGGDGAQIKHSSLNKDDGRNPHGTTAADVGAASESYVNNYVDSKGYATRSYVDSKSISHTRSHHGTNQVNASYSSTASDRYSQVNACERSSASGYCTQLNASRFSTASNHCSQVNASYESAASGYCSQVNASRGSTASGDRSQVNASYDSTASGYCSQVNASNGSTASSRWSQVNASYNVDTMSEYSVCGGYGATGAASTANRNWELDSRSGYVKIQMHLTSGYRFTDYGEYFENLTRGEIEMGVLMVLEGAKVRPAKEDEDFIGVVSGTAAIRLGDSPFCWQGRYLSDEWGRPVYEEIKDPAWQPKTVPDEKWSAKEGETEADRPMIPTETEEDRPTIRVQKENPDYDPEREQVPRSERPTEWTLVGLLGQVYVRCDGTVKSGDFVKSKDEGIGTRSNERTKLRAMKVTKEFDGKYSIVYCLLN